MRPHASHPIWLLELLLAAGVAGLASCASHRPTPPEEPTIQSLAGRHAVVDPERRIETTPAQAIAAYTDFLQRLPKQGNSADHAARAEALRRLADLEMERADEHSASSGAAPDFRAAVQRYETFLAAYPADPGNDRVLYQLARAQEQGGDIEAALRTLTRLVASHPDTAYGAEAQFRRGELLFTAGRHADAERAFAVVLQAKPESLYHERALYMRGWSLFKQGRLEDALSAFLGVLDRKLGATDADADADAQPALTRADRELLEDSFRVTSLSLQSLQGAQSIPAYIDSSARKAYEARVYIELAELYLKQERVKDAADTLDAFARLHPLHAQAPVLLSRVIGIHEKAGFATLALQAKQDFVTRYGHDSAFRRANPEGWQRAQPLVKTHLAELARHHHALAQKSHQASDVQAAVHWYRAWLESFPNEPEAAQSRFLLAELLFEDQRWAEAASEYEQVAYDYPAHARSAEAGYAVLLAQARLEAAPGDPASLQRQGVARALRFAQSFPADSRAGAVLTNAAEKLFRLHDGPQAAEVAQQVLALQPPAADAQRRVAWTVLAHMAFERAAFSEAERAYREVLALTAQDASVRSELDERLAASVYKQGEAARDAGELGAAVAHFERIAALTPNSGVRATAQYDAAAAQIALKDWTAAAHTLEDFRQRFPKHPLVAELPTKLAAAYLALERWGPAAVELESVSGGLPDPAAARDALWQAAELHAKADDRRAAARVYERYVAKYPQPLVQAIEAREHLAGLARMAGDRKAEQTWITALQQAEQAGGTERTERTRLLGARATLALAEPVFEAYRGVALKAPLQRQLKLKKARLEAALQACASVADYAVAEAVTAAAFHSASLYQDFGQALMTSQRPRQLKKTELEQYNVMLEEQAFPFEEKAIELHAANARRAANGIYDDWVQRSFTALAKLMPARYAKAERGAVAAPLAELEARLPADAAGWNALGVARRTAGRFDGARSAYDEALALQPAQPDALLNQAILHDLYLGQPAEALALYSRYLLTVPAGDATVSRWVADLQRRQGTPVAVRSKDAP